MSYNKLSSGYIDKYIKPLNVEKWRHITGHFGGIPNDSHIDECQIEQISEDGQGRITNNCKQFCKNDRKSNAVFKR